jgi:Flp pilus assembly protein TadB
MRLEGWNVLVLLVMLVVAAGAIVTVTLIVRWTLRLANRRREDPGPGTSQP